jgi:hypothetical protein
MSIKTNQYVYILGLMSLSLLFSACLEHGEDDPWLSFVTRNDRLTRLWELNTYSLQNNNKIETTITFTNTACDTSDIGGINIYSVARQESLADTILNATINQLQGSQSTNSIYNVKITYFLDIHDNSTYTCTGTYRYNDADIDAEVTGNFQVDNSWYWETGMRTDWAVTFLNFPMLDASAVAETGQPIRYAAVQTFDLRELRQNDLQLEAEMSISHINEQHFLPYTVVNASDTIYNCERDVITETTINNQENWTFIHKE